MTTITDASTPTVHGTSSDAGVAISRRLDEIWAAAAARDFERLESFHLYGPAFTSFKDAEVRSDAAANAAGERAFFDLVEAPKVAMNDLAIAVYGSVGIATFNGHFTATIHGAPAGLDQQATMVFVDSGDGWKLVHEHFSPLGGGPAADR